MTQQKIRKLPSSIIPKFVRSDIDLLRFFSRIEKRTERYPNWRQVFLDCFGMCQYPINDEQICGNPDTLEFHESYDDEGTVIQTVLVCNYHHFSIHQGIVNPRHYPSRLQIDVEVEIKLAGGLSEWQKKFNLIERKVEFDFTNNNRNSALDFKFSEDSENNGS